MASVSRMAGLRSVIEKSCGEAIDLVDAKERVSALITLLCEEKSNIWTIEIVTPQSLRVYLSQKKKCPIDEVAAIPNWESWLEKALRNRSQWHDKLEIFFEFDYPSTLQESSQFFSVDYEEWGVRFAFSDRSEQFLEFSDIPLEHRKYLNLYPSDIHRIRVENTFCKVFPATWHYIAKEVVRSLTEEELVTINNLNIERIAKIASKYVGAIQSVPSKAKILDAIDEMVLAFECA